MKPSPTLEKAKQNTIFKAHKCFWKNIAWPLFISHNYNFFIKSIIQENLGWVFFPTLLILAEILLSVVSPRGPAAFILHL